MHGDYIKVIIGTRAISEGYSFNNVIFESINTPHFNYSETAQAIARGIRLGSHNDLLNAGENPVVEILQPVGIPRKNLELENKNIESIDLKRYKLSEDKDVGIASFLRILMESAIDCGLNYRHNVVIGMDNSRECDYMNCEFKCDGIDMVKVKDGLEENELDYLTYNLYYANQPTTRIKESIENYLRKVGQCSISNLKSHLLNSFTEKHIDNVLKLFERSDEDMIDLQKFKDLYSTTPVRKIVYQLEEVFKNVFFISYNNIIKVFISNNIFEIISSLREIINNNIVIKNRYGFNCYLREDSNIYYLVNTLSGKPDYLLSYYTENLYAKRDSPFNEIFDDIVRSGYTEKIKRLAELSNNPKKFSEKMKLLDRSMQIIYLQSAIVSLQNGLNENKELRDAILEYFKTDYQKIQDKYIITITKPPICLDGNTLSDWKECDEKIIEAIGETKKGEAKKFEETKYGVYGKYNQKDDKFWIVDVEKEKESREIKGAKRGEKGKLDKRLKFGKNCISWILPELLEIIVRRLKINAHVEFLIDFNTDTLYSEIQKHKKTYLKKLVDDKSDREQLKRILYWGKFTVKNICNHLKKWFEDNNLLQYE
jgi:hypothetical protein